MSFRYVLIDVDDTLLDWHKSATLAMQRSFAAVGRPFPEHLPEVFFDVNEDLWRQIERGELDKPGLYAIRWNRVFAKAGIDLDGPPFEKHFLAALPTCAVPVAGAVELLRRLAGKYVLCAASNASHAQQMSRLRTSGIEVFFDHVFTSERMGAEKPSRAFFDACIRELGSPDLCEIAFIGDSPTADVAGAREAGLYCIHFDWRGHGPCGADLTVSSLDEIPL